MRAQPMRLPHGQLHHPARQALTAQRRIDDYPPQPSGPFLKAKVEVPHELTRRGDNDRRRKSAGLCHFLQLTDSEWP